MDSSSGSHPRGAAPPSQPVRAGNSGLLHVERPPWFDFAFVVLLTLIGTAAFAVTGFFGYSYQPAWMHSLIFHKPAALFIFGCILFIALQHVIMRHPAGTNGPQAELIVQRHQPYTALAATLISIALVVILDLYLPEVHAFLDAIRRLLQLNNVFQLILILINMYFLVVVLIEFAFRWVWYLVRIVRDWRDKHTRDEQIAKFLSEFANDMIAVATLALALAVLFQTQVFSALVGTLASVAHTGFSSLGPLPPINDCTLSFYQDCTRLAADYNPNTLPTITYFDVAFAGIAGFLGIMSFVSSLTGLLLVSKVSHPIGEAILDALRNLEIRKALVLAFEAIITPLQRALWPAFVFAGVFAIAFAAKECQLYLQLLSCQHQAQFGTLPANLPAALDCVPAWFDWTAQGYGLLGASLFFGAMAAVLVVIAAVVQLYVRGKPSTSGRLVAGYWIPAFVELTWAILIPFGIASIALLLLNLVLLPAVNSTLPQTFVPPGVVSYLALAALIVYYARRWLRRHRAATANRP